MAATVSATEVENPAYVRYKAGTLTFDASYPTGGLAVTPAAFGFKSKIDGIIFSPATDATTAVVAAFVPSTNKVKAFVSNGASPALLNEAPNATNLATQVVSFFAWGR